MGAPYHGIPMKGIKDILFLRRLIKSKKIEIIHSTLDRADYMGLIAARLAGVPIVSTMMVPRCHPAYRFMDRVAVLSIKQRDILLAKGIAPAKVEVIRPGIDVARFANPDKNKREAWKTKAALHRFDLVFCHISSMLPRKAHQVSLELTKTCKDRGATPLLFIIGDPLEGEYVASLKRYISDHDLNDNVHFTGWTKDVPEILSLSHYTLLPSADEALGVVLMEGMAAGTPIIARSGEGGAELVKEYDAGFLYDPLEGILSLTDRLLSFHLAEQRYQEKSKACKDTAVREFSMENFGKKLSALYAKRSLERQ